ncbi:MAG: single-stranded-DNA-specific exonuclease RecJ [Alphaproteobacteria bacterium]|nr:MAG: single-stranded-DNA-specific exonuclease RecJ [Alphaproteobacteria bacterium]
MNTMVATKPEVPEIICAGKKTASGRSWQYRLFDHAACVALREEAGLDDTLAQLLAMRHVNPTEVGDFLNPTLKKLLPDPSHLHDMDRAVKRLIQAIKSQETIGIIGDYDVDGACSTAILVHYLKHMHVACHFIIPDRILDGYGPQPHLIERLQHKGCSLIITLDCGSTATAALAFAQKQRLDLIVIDHHSMQEIPDTFALVNPNRPDQTSNLTNLCAAGVVFIYLVGVNRALRQQGYWNQAPEGDLRDYLDLVALATVCDVMPLTGLNRAFVKWGLDKLRHPRPGIQTLMAVIGIKEITNAYHLGFVIGPHINAGGRVGSPDIGTKLLLSDHKDEGRLLAEKLKDCNNERRDLEKKAISHASHLAKDLVSQNVRFLVIHQSDWHPGIIGIVAGRIKDMFHRPVAILCGSGDSVKGSVRSIPGIHAGNIMQNLVNSGTLIQGGGHAMAAGLTVHEENIHALQSRANMAVSINAVSHPHTDVDMILSPSGATVHLIKNFNTLAPYGNGNPTPTCIITHAIIEHIRDIKGEHIGLTLSDAAGGRLDGIAFRTSQSILGDMIHMNKGKPCHFLGTLSLNAWNGNERPQLIISDVCEANP